MTVELKICGITRLEDARFCAGAGVDYLGFIQYPQSPRFIEPKRAKEIIEWVHGPRSVGVFVNESPETVNRIADDAGFDLVQLHGHEDPDTCAQIERPIIKAFRVVHDASAEQLRLLMEPYRDVVSLFLLDTFKTSLWGGTGESFNWRLVRDLSEEFPLFLAGGINASNIREAVLTMRPHGIDISSSVESEPGIKDFDQLTAFFEAFEQAVTDYAP